VLSRNSLWLSMIQMSKLNIQIPFSNYLVHFPRTIKISEVATWQRLVTIVTAKSSFVIVIRLFTPRFFRTYLEWMMMEILIFQTSICHLVSDSGTAVQPRTRTLARSYRLALFARIFLRTTDQCRHVPDEDMDLDHLLSSYLIMYHDEGR